MPIKSGRALETLYLMNIMRSRPLLDGLDFVGITMNAMFAYDKAKKEELVNKKFTFFFLKIKIKIIFFVMF